MNLTIEHGRRRMDKAELRHGYTARGHIYWGETVRVESGLRAFRDFAELHLCGFYVGVSR